MNIRLAITIFLTATLGLALGSSPSKPAVKFQVPAWATDARWCRISGPGPEAKPEAVQAKLAYLKELGINTLFFDAPCPPAPKEGDVTQAAYVTFLRNAHREGFRVVFRAPGVDPTATKNHRFIDPRVLATSLAWMDPNGDGDPSDGIDGWTVAYPPGSTTALWKQWRTRLKTLNPNCLFVFNTIAGAIRRQDSLGNAIMDDTASTLFGRLSAAPDADAALPKFFAGLAKLSQRANTNAIHGSPVPSMASTVGGVRGARLFAVLQHTVTGVPMVELRSTDLAPIIQWFNLARGAYPPLRQGKLRPLFVDEKKKVVTFARTMPGDEVIVVLNLSPNKQKVMLHAGQPGQAVQLLNPGLNHPPRPLPVAKPPLRPEQIIPRLQTGGSWQFVAADGTIRAWVAGNSVCLVHIKDSPKR